MVEGQGAGPWLSLWFLACPGLCWVVVNNAGGPLAILNLQPPSFRNRESHVSVEYT
jgi:hypothetical protein